jgi:hypothetical protein
VYSPVCPFNSTKVQQARLGITDWLDIILPAYFLLISFFIFGAVRRWVTFIVSLAFIISLLSDRFQVVLSWTAGRAP